MNPQPACTHKFGSAGSCAVLNRISNPPALGCWSLVLVLQIHHGNGTQKVFWEDDRVLFVSLHRRDKDFYPEVSLQHKALAAPANRVTQVGVLHLCDRPCLAALILLNIQGNANTLINHMSSWALALLMKSAKALPR